MNKRLAHFLLLLLCMAAPFLGAEPEVIYLTWQRSPETTMTIQWITRATEQDNTLYYKRPGAPKFIFGKSSVKPMPDHDAYAIHTAELTGLIPDTTYQFKVGEQGEVHRFRTMPDDLKKPISFVEGGDLYQAGTYENFRKMNRVAASLNPSFVVMGGDLAYAYSSKSSDAFERWMVWLKTLQEDLVAKDGRMIPMITAIGNHDAGNTRRFPNIPKQTPGLAPYFYALFAFPGLPGYNVLDFGHYMSLIILDTGHTNPIAGAQTEWLAKTLEKRQFTPNKFMVYHVGAYPSYREMDGRNTTAIRTTWIPLFDKFGVQTAFEHHDHTYKRTHPLKGNRIDPKGILYIGDGAWASKARPPATPQQRWYLAKSAQAQNIIYVTVSTEGRHYLVLEENGRIIDEFVN